MLEGLQLGHYQLLRLIGSGGMSEVYLAEDPRIRRQVAIKVVHTEAPAYPQRRTESEGARLFLREARAIAQLDHPHILPLFDYGEENVRGRALTYLVMPFRAEGSLAQWLKQRGDSDLLPLEDVTHIVHQAASALQYAHDHHVIHQDVKPSNFLIRDTGDTGDQPHRPDLILADFGVAKLSEGTTNTSQSIWGTPRYMAPEQWSAAAVPASDQYSLAVMVYELLTGQSPSAGPPLHMMYQHTQALPPPSTLNPRLSTGIDRVVLRALAKNPADRFPSITAFADAFRQAAQRPTAPAVMQTSTGMMPGGDLHTVLAISEEEAQRGTSRTLTLPGGHRVTVSVPAQVYDGQVLRLEGLSDPTSPEGSGALILTISVQETKKMPHSPGDSSIEKTILLNRPPTKEKMPAPDGDARSNRVSSAGPAPLTPVVSDTSQNKPTGHQRFGRKTTWLIVFVALAVVTGAGFFWLLEINRTISNHPGVTTTPTVRKATANPQTTATPIVTVNATATIIAENFDPYPPQNGRLILYDPLIDNHLGFGWDEYKTDSSGGACQFANDGYHVIQLQPNINSCLANVQLGNFAFEAQMSILKGDCGGIIFRSDINSSKDYTFEVCQDGSYNLYLDLNTTTQTLLSSTSVAIHRGLHQVNTIAVVANRSGVDLYVNHQKIASVNDSTYSRGYIGMIVEDMNNPTEVVYSHARVWTF